MFKPVKSLIRPAGMLIAGTVVLAGLSACETSSYYENRYARYFDACDQRAGICYNSCADFAEGEAKTQCQSSCSAEVDQCFADVSERIALDDAYRPTYTPMPFYGRYGYYQPGYGYRYGPHPYPYSYRYPSPYGYGYDYGYGYGRDYRYYDRDRDKDRDEGRNDPPRSEPPRNDPPKNIPPRYDPPLPNPGLQPDPGPRPPSGVRSSPPVRQPPPEPKPSPKPAPLKPVHPSKGSGNQDKPSRQ